MGGVVYLVIGPKICNLSTDLRIRCLALINAYTINQMKFKIFINFSVILVIYILSPTEH